MNIGIVTSFYNGYGKFLPDWAKSISGLRIPPTAVTAVASGENHGLTKDIKKLVQELIPNIKIYYLPEHKGMGYARNKAVEYTETEWIMYLDVDDLILPHALNDFSQLQENCDVISCGFEMTGEKRGKKIFSNVTTQKVLEGGHYSCSHNPYRKKFWEQMPYIEQNDYVDRALWVGFAQLGARFKNTKRVCTIYRRRLDSHSFNMSPDEKLAAQRQFRKFVKEGVTYD